MNKRAVALLAVAAAYSSTLPVNTAATPASSSALPETEANRISDELTSWSEDATREFFNATLELPWRNRLGDWVASDGLQQGEKAFSTASLEDDNSPSEERIDVTDAFKAAGRLDFLIQNMTGGAFEFHSREAQDPTLRPYFLIDGKRIEVIADTHLNASTYKALGDGPTLSTRGNILIRGAGQDASNPVIAELVLHSTGSEFGSQTIGVFLPVASLPTADIPDWANVDAREILSIDAGDLPDGNSAAIVSGNIATAKLFHPELSWFNTQINTPSQETAFLTIFIKLHDDFKPGQGGKLPGLANTGLQDPGHSKSVNGVQYADSAWGGRGANGLRWSARSGYRGWTEHYVGLHTYFYALAPKSNYGWSEAVGVLPKGRRTAYVQGVKVNTPGLADGGLYYETLEHGPVYARNDIKWREVDAPEALIQAGWINVYRGGKSCGKEYRGQVSIAGGTITKGRPDMALVAAKVACLNAEQAQQ